MGEIFHALEVLNRSMKLGLSGKDLLRAEMGFKSALAMQGNPAAAQLASDPVRLAERYEIKATLRVREAKLSLDQLSKLAGQAIRQPHTRVAAATFRQIDQAMAPPALILKRTRGTTAEKSGAPSPGTAQKSASKKSASKKALKTP